MWPWVAAEGTPPYAKGSWEGRVGATGADGALGPPVLTKRPRDQDAQQQGQADPTLMEPSAPRTLLDWAERHSDWLLRQHKAAPLPLGPRVQPDLFCSWPLLSEGLKSSQAPSASSPGVAPAPQCVAAPPAASSLTPEACHCSPPPCN